jgi:hypothetical protein
VLLYWQFLKAAAAPVLVSQGRQPTTICGGKRIRSFKALSATAAAVFVQLLQVAGTKLYHVCAAAAVLTRSCYPCACVPGCAHMQLLLLRLC